MKNPDIAKSICYLLIGCTLLLTGCSQIAPSVSVDKDALGYLDTLDKSDVSSSIEALHALRNPQDDTTSSENGSEENDSQTENFPTEERITIEAIREEIATSQAPSGVLTPWKVSTLMDSEVPALRSLFSDTIIIGNSRARSILDSGILTTNEVMFQWGAHVDEIMDMTTQAATLYRGKILFIMGCNDMGYYCDDTAGFKEDYIALIDAYRNINPYSEIYLQEILPIDENFSYRWKNRHRMDTYNAIIREICEEKDCTYVSASYYALPEFLRDDGTGAHYNYQYHIYWAQTMANQMNLWEDAQ